MFINCWNVDDTEDARMWAEYTTCPKSVAISTTFERLLANLPAEQLNMSRVKYIDDSAPRGEFFHTTPFFYKDEKFSFEKELRLVRPLLADEQVQVEDEIDFGKLVAVDITRMLDRIVANKNIPKPVFDYVRQIAAKYCNGAEVLRSAVEPRILYV